MPLAKCQTGKIRAIQTIQAGALLPSGMNTPDRNSSGRIDALTIAGEASALGMAAVIANPSAQKLAAPPEIHARGSGIDDASFGEVLPRIEEALALAAADGITDTHQISQLARRIVGKWVSDNYRRRPMIIPVVIQA